MELTLKVDHADLYREGEQLMLHVVGLDLTELMTAVAKFQADQAALAAEAAAATEAPESPEV